jgi:nitrite reductase/ring-hydroxylating ferredoxin subunit
MAQTVATTEELRPGDRKFVEINGIEVTVLNVNGEIYAIRNFCPHMEGPVGRGLVENEGCETPTIDCPFHGWSFDLETGEVSFGNSKRLTTFDTEVVDGEIRVDI